MNSVLKIAAVVAGLLVAPAFVLLSANWNLDPAYSIRFKGTKAEGTFSGLTGLVVFDPANLPVAKMEVQVAAATIKTGNKIKDGHARGESWFDVARYPEIRFHSTAFSRVGAGGYSVSGDLTLHGIKKPVAIPFQFTRQADKGLFTGKLRVNRKDFGINGNIFGFTVGDEFEVELRVPVAR